MNFGPSRDNTSTGMQEDLESSSASEEELPRAKRRPDRRNCPHCDELVSYKTFKKHRRLYYNLLTRSCRHAVCAEPPSPTASAIKRDESPPASIDSDSSDVPVGEVTEDLPSPPPSDAYYTDSEHEQVLTAAEESEGMCVCVVYVFPACYGAWVIGVYPSFVSTQYFVYIAVWCPEHPLSYLTTPTQHISTLDVYLC